jgi:hypothetical protein
MPRPAPNVLLKTVTDQKFRVEEVILAEAVYAVYYHGNPISLKSYIDLASSSDIPRYKKTSFPSSGHAHALANRLNTQFKTDEFSVMIMNSATKHVKE